MKKIILTLSLMIISSIGFSQWTVLSGAYNYYHSCFFIDANNGIAVGASGACVKTVNGGATWSWVAGFNTSTELMSVFFTSLNNGYTVDDEGHIYKTTNGGSSWTMQISGSYAPLNSIFFINSNIGYIVGDNAILKTIDAGTTWITQTHPLGINILNSVYFTDPNTGYAVGNSGKIINTIDGGTNWTVQTVGFLILSSVFFADANTGYAVGGSNLNEAILKTIDAGTTWTTQTSGGSHWLKAVCFTTPNNGYAMGNAGTILKTTNGGKIWTTEPIVAFCDYNSIVFPNANTGYAAGSENTSNGNIIKTTGSVFFDEIYNTNSIKIYPNPNIGKFTFEFENPKHQLVQINILDFTGKTVFKTNTTKETYNFNANELTTGAYYVELIGENLKKVGKIVVQ
jgi:photosystem II stability/assembly factor-like uncharacterized protein